MKRLDGPVESLLLRLRPAKEQLQVCHPGAVGEHPTVIRGRCLWPRIAEKRDKMVFVHGRRNLWRGSAP